MASLGHITKMDKMERWYIRDATYRYFVWVIQTNLLDIL